MQVVAGSFDFSFITPNAPTAHAHDSRKKPTAIAVTITMGASDVQRCPMCSPALNAHKLPKHHLTTPGSKQ
jgi:hypothetical protein